MVLNKWSSDNIKNIIHIVVAVFVAIIIFVAAAAVVIY
jgi:hypothetical protein